MFVEYDKTCAIPGLQGVEISYAILNRSVTDLLPDTNVSLEVTLYPLLAQRRQLRVMSRDHRYFSVGAQHRLPLTEAFFARQPAVILDRDGVLNKRPPKAHYVRAWEEFEWLPGSREALRLFNAGGFSGDGRFQPGRHRPRSHDRIRSTADPSEDGDGRGRRGWQDRGDVLLPA